MKVGIITIHKSEVNYGACLQCFALWKFISNLGHDCEVIDLRRPSQKGYKYQFSFSGIKAFLVLGLKLQFCKFWATLRDRKFKTRGQRYRDFNNNIKYSTVFCSPSEIEERPPVYDVYISGSDQIWNPNMTFDNKPYLLSFVPIGKKRIAYASSFGVEKLPSNVICLYIKYLKLYNHISTRENGGKKLVKNLIDKDIPVSLDPVFLLSAEEWFDVVDKAYNLNNDYLFVYSLHNNDELLLLAIGIAKRLNCKVILVNADYNVCNKTGVTQLRDVGPSQWLCLIKEAKLFLTDSFHGTAFSIIFEKPFLTFCKESAKTNDRIFTLLSKLGLDSHIITSKQISFDISIKKAYSEMEKCKENVLKNRKESIDYLLHAIQ